VISYVGQFVKDDDLRLRRIEYPTSELALDEAMRAFTGGVIQEGGD